MIINGQQHIIINPSPIELDSGFAPASRTQKSSPNLNDVFENSLEKDTATKQSLVSAWDVPGVFTYSWLRSAAQSLQSRGDYNGPMGRAIGGLMILASPVVIPASLLADVINTIIFPAKLIYRSL